jgi:hypothetical protein
LQPHNRLRAPATTLCAADDALASVHNGDRWTWRAHRLLYSTASAYRSKAVKEDDIDALREMLAEERDALLDEALALIEASPAPAGLFSRRWPVRLPSRRAALGGFKRLMARMEGVEPGSGQRFQDGEQPRRRRFLLTLLRQAATNGGVHRVESDARRRERRAVPTMAEMLERTPEIETPAYEVLASREAAGWEVRRYDQFAVVSTASARAVEQDGRKLSTPTMGGAGAFQALAGYLFGGNQEGQRLAMTTPVISASNAAGVRRLESSNPRPLGRPRISRFTRVGPRVGTGAAEDELRDALRLLGRGEARRRAHAQGGRRRRGRGGGRGRPRRGGRRRRRGRVVWRLCGRGGRGGAPRGARRGGRGRRRVGGGG